MSASKGALAIQALARKGAGVRLDGEKLILFAISKQGKITDEHRAFAKANKSDIITAILEERINPVETVLKGERARTSDRAKEAERNLTPEPANTPDGDEASEPSWLREGPVDFGTQRERVEDAQDHRPAVDDPETRQRKWEASPDAVWFRAEMARIQRGA